MILSINDLGLRPGRALWQFTLSVEWWEGRKNKGTEAHEKTATSELRHPGPDLDKRLEVEVRRVAAATGFRAGDAKIGRICTRSPQLSGNDFRSSVVAEKFDDFEDFLGSSGNFTFHQIMNLAAISPTALECTK